MHRVELYPVCVWARVPLDIPDSSNEPANFLGEMKMALESSCLGNGVYEDGTDS